ncbi:PepSY domain-containing protein [Salipaludibacillus daqingensis]|uniref:PepSY domain-containing protein n=1 Tax=Salipaludibacillus daqingensis TaxID=3041001 RepID=UPI002476CBA9|nr:PepSY domain-containing protein [Salipaludibacillus daqingensis]
MGWKKFAAGMGAGVAVTILAKNQLEKTDGKLSPEKALKLVKRKTTNLGTIEGSWVHMVTEEFEQDHLLYDVYRGGITCSDESGKMHAYEFFVDSSTGTVLALNEQDA